MGRVPLPGASGFKGATAVTTTGPDPNVVQSTTNACAVSLYVYSLGGGANNPIDQLTASGVTVVGEEEKVPVAANSIRVPLVVLLMAMDWRCRPPLPHVRTVTQTKSRRSRARNRFMGVFLSVHHTSGSTKRVRLPQSRAENRRAGHRGLGEAWFPRLAKAARHGVPALTNGST